MRTLASSSRGACAGSAGMAPVMDSSKSASSSASSSASPSGVQLLSSSLSDILDIVEWVVGCGWCGSWRVEYGVREVISRERRVRRGEKVCIFRSLHAVGHSELTWQISAEVLVCRVTIHL
jgi:hypothetical protein